MGHLFCDVLLCVVDVVHHTYGCTINGASLLIFPECGAPRKFAGRTGLLGKSEHMKCPTRTF